MQPRSIGTGLCSSAHNTNLSLAPDLPCISHTALNTHNLETPGSHPRKPEPQHAVRDDVVLLNRRALPVSNCDAIWTRRQAPTPSFVRDPPGKNRFTCISVVFPTGKTSARTLSNERGPSLGGGASGAYRASGGLAIATMCPLTRCVGSAQQPNGRFNLFSYSGTSLQSVLCLCW